MGGVRHPYGETILIHPYVEGDYDPNGNPVVSWGEPVERDHVAVAPHMVEKEDNGQRSMVVSGYDLYDTFDAPIGPRDQITVRGDRYEIDGEVERWRNPYTGVDRGSKIIVKRVSG
jgi:hypothetical protein